MQSARSSEPVSATKVFHMIANVTDRLRFARALRSRSYALLWTGQTISALGDGAFMVALAWSVLILTGSATALAEVLIAQSVPRLLFLLIGGVVADRLPRRLILLWSDGGRAVVVLLIGVLFLLHLITLWHIVTLAVLFGIADAFFAPAYQAIPPQLVPPEDLPSANALTNVSRQASTFIGPALGALLVAVTNAGAAFAFDGLTFMISACCLLAMPAHRRILGAFPSAVSAGETSVEEQLASHAGVLSEIGEGFTYLMSSSWLWVGTLIAAVGNVGFAALQVSLPQLVHHVYGEGVWLLGALLSATALGSMVASLVIGQMSTLRHRGIAAYLWITVASVALLALGLPLPHSVVVDASLSEAVVIGLGIGAFTVVYYTTLQELVPADKLGRVSSIDWLGSFALEPVGLAVVGILTDRWGPAPVFIWGGALNIALGAVALCIRGIRDVDTVIAHHASAANNSTSAAASPPRDPAPGQLSLAVPPQTAISALQTSPAPRLTRLYEMRSVEGQRSGQVSAQLEAMWWRALGRESPRQSQHESPSSTDSFIGLGGDIASASFLLAQIWQQFSVDLPVRDILGGTTLEGLAALLLERLTVQSQSQTGLSGVLAPLALDQHVDISSARAEHSEVDGDSSWYETVPVPALGARDSSMDTGAVPCTRIQRRIWGVHNQYPEVAAGHLVSAHVLAGPLDVDALQRCVLALAIRHAALRTRFIETSGVPSPVVQAALQVPELHVEDVSGIGPTERELHLRRRLEAEAQRPFDFEHGPFLRLLVVRQAAEVHTVALIVHSLVCDAWSVGILTRELCQLYPAACDGRSAQSLARLLPRPRLQLSSDQATTTHTSVLGSRAPVPDASETLPISADDQFQQSSRILDLPSDTSGLVHGPAIAGAHRSYRCSREQSQLVRRWSQQHNVTVEALLLATWIVVLSRYSGQDDVVLGLQLSNRDIPQWLDVCGQLSATVGIGVRLSETVTFQELVQQVHECLIQASEQARTPVDSSRSTVEHEDVRTEQGWSIHNVEFSMSNRFVTSLRLPGLVSTPCDIETGTALTDLSVEGFDDGCLIGGRVEYRTKLFSAALIERLIQHIQTILIGGITAGQHPVVSLPLLTAGERDSILHQWNHTQLPLPNESLVHDLILEQALQNPQATAVVASTPSGTIECSYLRLRAQATALSSRLSTLGVTVDTPVAIVLDRSIAWVVGQLAILVAGGYYVLVDPRQPAERIRTILTEARPLAVLTSPGLFAEHRATTLGLWGGLRTLYLDPNSAEVVAESAATALPDLDSSDTLTQPDRSRTSTSVPRSVRRGAEAEPASPTRESLAYCIFTSGSTGTPKGVCLSHAGVLNLVTWMQDAFKLRAADRCTSLAGLGFDVTVSEIWPTLASGATLYLVDEMRRYDAKQLQSFLLANEITVTDVPAPLCERLLALPWPPSSKLRVMLTGDDRFHCFAPPGLPFTVYNAYGPTEATVTTTWGPVPSVGEATALGFVMPSIGWPIDNVQVYVLDRHLQPVPVGVPGQLYIGGIGLAREYLNRPELTREKFIPNPFDRATASSGRLAEGNSRLFCTGDIVKWSASGELHFLGRGDSQIKIRGFRIEPGEVEATLLEAARRLSLSVHGAHVEAVEKDFFADDASHTNHNSHMSDNASAETASPSADRALVGFVEVSNAGEMPVTLEGELRKLLVQRLPRYMIPARILFLEKTPFTPNGKVDRAAARRCVKDSELARSGVPARK